MHNYVIRKLLVAFCALFGAAALAQQAPPAPPTAVQQELAESPVAGAWQGAIEIPGMPLEVTVRLTLEAAGWQGSIDIPAQGAVDLPLGDIVVEGTEATFAISGIPGDPVFSGTVEDDRITGTFSQSGQEFPFTLTRQDADEAAAPTGYEDPEGRFSVTIPTGWTATKEDGYAHLASPAGGINVYLLVSESADPETAVAEGWTTVLPDFTLEPTETIEPPSTPGVERSVLVNYDSGNPDELFQALAQLHDDTVYTMLIAGDLEALQRRAAQLQIVATSFRITALEETDLSEAQPRSATDLIAEFEPFVAETLEAFGVPGAAVAIVQGDEIVYASGFGVIEAGSDEPVTPDTQLMIGSTGKTMTSLLVATLVDDGLIDWDTPVAEVLPEFAVADPELSREITFRNLLCACTGVPRRDFELFFNADELSAEAIIESLSTFEFFTDFGEAFQYSNQLVGTAGYAAAAADGATFGNLFDGYVTSLHERVLDPIGMPHTTLSFADVRERGEYAIPHQVDLDSGDYEPIDLALEEMLMPIAPAGAHWSTASDMARYLLTELNRGVSPDGETVVSEENLRETWEPQVPISATDSYGLGWIVSDYHGLEMFSHGGNTLGFTSEFAFLPDADLGVVVLANAQGANGFTGAVVGRLLELVYDQPAQSAAQIEFVVAQSERMLEQAQESIQAHAAADEVEQYLGTYENAALGGITLTMEDGQLVMDAGEFSSEIRPMLNDRGEFDAFVTYGVPLAGLPVELRLEDGKPVVLLGQGAVLYRFEQAD